MDENSSSKFLSASDSTEIRSGKPEVTDSGATLTLSPLKSVQPYRTQDEFLVAMKEDLAEWLNSVYELEMDETSLFTHLATGVLLCRHANAFNAVAKTQDPAGTVTSRRNSGIVSSGLNLSTSGFSSSGVCPSASGSSGSASVTPFSAVQFREGVQPGSFQSRDNIANFLAWCRNSLRLRDTLLFETEDLVQGRNERNVVLCLLEVARRGSRIGMPAPSLVRLEAEIDAEIARDEAASRLLGSDESNAETRDLRGDVQCHEDDDAGQLLLLQTDRHGNEGRTRDAEVQTMDESLTEAASPPPGSHPTPPFLLLRSSFDSISSSSDSSSVRGGHSHPHHPPPHHPPAQPPPAAATVRQRRPVIEVDMMSLDEMVRNILNKCTCEFQYPMVRVSEGKYKIGDSLTLIFVRILRNHVMVRIGGGWDTLENYLYRHDPCRMETRATKSGSSHSRIGAHSCGGSGLAGTGSGGTGLGVTGVGVTEEMSRDGGVSCDTYSKAKNDRGSLEENPVLLETSVGCTGQTDLSSRPDDPIIDEAQILNRQTDDLASDTMSTEQSLQNETNDCAAGEADRSTGTALSDRRTKDVACQTDDPTRRYSSSSGASSWESASRDERCGRVGVNGGRIDVTLDVAAQRDFDNSHSSRIEDSDGLSTDPLCSRQDYTTPEANDCGRDSRQGSIGKQGLSGPGCPQCGQSAVSGKQTAGLCRLCRQRRGQLLRPGSAKIGRQLPQCPSAAASEVPGQPVSCLGSAQVKRFRAQRPASAQEKKRHLPVLDSEARLGTPPRAVSAIQRPSSAQGQRQRTVGSASAQKQRRRTLGPAAIEEHMTYSVGPSSSTPGQLTRTASHALGHQPVKEQRRSSLQVPGQLHHTLTTGLAQDPLLGHQRTRQLAQRPASAQDNRRLAKRSKAAEEESTASGFFPVRFSQRPSTLTSPQKVAPTKTKSQEDLTTRDCATTPRTSPQLRSPVRQKIGSRSTISSHGDRQLIRELFRMKKLDVGCSYDIPELVELSIEDPLPPTTSTDLSSHTRPRKEVGRSGSFSKIPKPVSMN